MKKNRIFIIFLICLICRAAGAVEIERVSVGPNGVQSEGDTMIDFLSVSISADGRYVAFESRSENLVPENTNGYWHIFVRDRQAGRTELVSINTNEIPGNYSSFYPSISDDGRYVAFESAATNLAPGTESPSYARQVFIRDRQAGRTELVSVSSNGTIANNVSNYPVVSADGRYVTFRSKATNLVSVNTNGYWNIFVRDRQTGRTELVSADSNSTPGNESNATAGISADGRYVAFNSAATNLVVGDTEDSYVNCFVRDRETGRVEKLVGSYSSCGNDTKSMMSANGRYVIFVATNTDLIPDARNQDYHVFVHDRQTGRTEWISENLNEHFSGDGGSISADGRYVAFNSWGIRSDVFVRDRETGRTELVSIGSNNVQADGDSIPAVISADGNHVAFSSLASNLVPGDTNGGLDVFVASDIFPPSIPPPPPPPSPPPPPPPSTSHTFRCEENDGGKVPTQAGKVRQFKDDNPPIVYEDTCCRKEYLKEYFCNNETGQKEIQWYRAKECKNGAAVASSGFISPVPASDIPFLCRIQNWWQSFRRR